MSPCVELPVLAPEHPKPPAAPRMHELATFLEAAQAIGSTLELGPVLTLICQQVTQMIGCASAGLVLAEDDGLVIAASSSRPEQVGMRLPKHRGPAAAVIAGRAPVIIADVRGSSPEAAWFRAITGSELDSTLSHVRAWLSVPMIVQGKVIGALGASHPEPTYFTPQHAELAMVIASQAAVAIENARLHGQVRALAVVEERQRLARELHDSVAQALYGIGLGAQTALTWLERDPSRVAEPLRYIQELAETGMAEMRALIFALRPETLAEEGLVRTLQRQAAALQARYRVAVTIYGDVEPDVPLAVKEALFRIAQEAMHNAVKHAQPHHIVVRIACEEYRLQLTVSDDGTGFDPSASFPGHLGLTSMTERARQFGGHVAITSSPGHGTRVAVSIP